MFHATLSIFPLGFQGVLCQLQIKRREFPVETYPCECQIEFVIYEGWKHEKSACPYRKVCTALIWDNCQINNTSKISEDYLFCDSSYGSFIDAGNNSFGFIVKMVTYLYALSFHIWSVIIHHLSSSSGMKIESSRSLNGHVKQYNFTFHDHTAVPYIGIDKHIFD
jgi:hypothetical protein